MIFQNLNQSKMRKNNFSRFIKGETALHKSVAEYIERQYPYCRYHHSPNEGKRSPYERYIISLMGVSKGFPDFMIWGEYGGILYLELKHDKNTPTKEQIEWLKFLGGYVCWTFDACKELLDNFIKNKINTLADNSALTKDGYYIVLSDILPASVSKKINNIL